MANLLDSIKRNWLAYSIVAVLLAVCLTQIWITYLASDASWKNLSDAKFVFIFAFSAVMLVLFLVIGDTVSDYFITRFGLKVQKRYLVALLFVAANILRGITDWGILLSDLPLLIFLSIVGGGIILLLYFLSDFVSNTVILFSQTKSNSKEKSKSDAKVKSKANNKSKTKSKN